MLQLDISIHPSQKAPCHAPDIGNDRRSRTHGDVRSERNCPRPPHPSPKHSPKTPRRNTHRGPTTNRETLALKPRIGSPETPKQQNVQPRVRRSLQRLHVLDGLTVRSGLEKKIPRRVLRTFGPRSLHRKLSTKAFGLNWRSQPCVSSCPSPCSWDRQSRPVR